MAIENRHITRISDTLAGLAADLDNLQIAVTTDNISEGYKAFVYKDDAGNLYECAVQDEDATFTDLTVTGTTTLTGVTTFSDQALIIVDNGDDTKKAAFECSGITAGTTRIFAFPDSNGTIMCNLVEDTTPQLGGNLDLNGNSIDFPTTANISDCLDEDNMASNSATKICTQQSIKKYVDDTVATYLSLSGGVMTGDIELDGNDIDFGGGNIIIPDNTTFAFEFNDTSLTYITINSTNGAEHIRSSVDFQSYGGTKLHNYFVIQESASAYSDEAGYGQIWIKNNTPNTPKYTDDAGNDFNICISDATTGGSGSAGSGNQYIEINFNGTTYKMLHDGTV